MERLQIKNDIEGMQEALIEAKKAFAIGEIPIGAIICDDKAISSLAVIIFAKNI
mgnify:FL=1